MVRCSFHIFVLFFKFLCLNYGSITPWCRGSNFLFNPYVCLGSISFLFLGDMCQHWVILIEYRTSKEEELCATRKYHIPLRKLPCDTRKYHTPFGEPSCDTSKVLHYLWISITKTLNVLYGFLRNGVRY